ncbi:MAG: hypothetical protein N4A59_03970 [Marinifilum sp.]|jgi:hypothetical protein|nr:hypothetical protein [Marinifilum sp.]
MFSIIIFFLVSFFEPINSSSISCTNNQVFHEKQQDNIVVCDTSKICFYDKEVQDTLIGRGVIRIRLFSKKCNDIKIKEGHLIFLHIKSKIKGENVLEYRYLVLDDLNADERRMLLGYEKRILSVLKKRGLCCLGDAEYLNSDKFDFPLTFTVVPH